MELERITLQQPFVVVEGLSGIGKNTVIGGVEFILGCERQLLLTEEPTGEFYGDRALVRLRKGMNDLETTLLLLMDRYVHMRTISGSTDPESTIIMNRYGLSSLVYQNEEHHGIIREVHRFLPTPDLTVVIDADYDDWVEANREHFLVKSWDGDRGGFRATLRNRQVYDSYRNMYLENHIKHITGKLIVLKAFRPLEDMAREVMNMILRISPSPTDISVEDKILRESLQVRKNEVVKDSGRNKIVMVKVEGVIYHLLSFRKEFGVDDVYEMIDEKMEKDAKKLMGSIISKLLEEGYIESTRKIKDRDEISGLGSNVVIYKRGRNFFAWERR